MKKLGLIGGTGPESTILYYKKIVYGVQEKVGKHYFPNLTIESINVFDVLEKCKKKDYEGLIKYLLCAIKNLESTGVDFISLSGNTPHIVFDELQKGSNVPLISIVESTLKNVRNKGLKKVGLIGTIFTMNEDFFKKPFRNSDIEIVIPNEEEKIYINNKISDELEIGVIKEETIFNFLKIIHRMKNEDNIEAIILGCTELPLLFENIEMPIESIDTVQIHINDINKIILDIN